MSIVVEQGESRIFVAPFSNGVAAGERDWICVTYGTGIEAAPWWSPDRASCISCLNGTGSSASGRNILISPINGPWDRRLMCKIFTASASEWLNTLSGRPH